ncbi:YraN family protein [Empedobacter stercoris]|uniref:YraN family protein n=1 Tax=Empedobacter stercoris TaxID=1628248 RepID=UPI0021AF3C57|nr:YraN family protein [Empedobacter stercoris]UWX65875.1 YraN family protein [Empedobacter stercoris]
MSNSYDFGKEAEDFGVKYLTEKGYKILAKNYFFRKAEIDIIAQTENEIIIVEVKARTSNYISEPETAVNAKKKKLLILAADDFIQKNNFICEVRFDILALLKIQQSWSVNHIQNAFDASEI